MIKKLKTALLSLALVFSFGAPVAATVAVSAQAPSIENGLCAGSDLTTNGTCNSGTQQQAEDTINDLIKTVINVFSFVVGVVSVIMIIIGGLKYITSGGDSGNITGAKNTILYAIIGLVIVALSQIIVQFVLGKVT